MNQPFKTTPELLQYFNNEDKSKGFPGDKKRPKNSRDVSTWKTL